MKINPLGVCVVLMAFLCSCTMLKQDGQGVKGQVTWLEGNQMPKVTEQAEQSVNPKGTPVKRVILIYPLTKLQDSKMENGLFQSLATEPITQVETDDNGAFSIELAPGSYSIFTKENEGIFANSFDADGNIQPITIKNGEWQVLDIVINYRATF
ncbi:carboxypeptidase regulatory-like domain-containing protein [Algoriphagus namhaensis]|uniref:Carboxypeptidase regulatory-like domain-containing protein n=1 Tax=Algoriphagus namhaensis TaxID=915353 RepID=A0ABV8ART6_9BACT